MKKHIAVSPLDVYLLVDINGKTTEVSPPSLPTVSPLTPAPVLPTTHRPIIESIVQQLVNNVVLRVDVENTVQQLVNHVVLKIEVQNFVHQLVKKVVLKIETKDIEQQEAARRTQSVQNLSSLVKKTPRVQQPPRSQSCGELTSQCHSPFLSKRSILTTTRVTQLAEDPNLFNKVMNTNDTVSFRFPYLGLREPQKTIQIPPKWKWNSPKRMLSWEEENIYIQVPTGTTFITGTTVGIILELPTPTNGAASITVTNGADVSTYHDIICSDNMIRLINTETSNDLIICDEKELPQQQLNFPLFLPPEGLDPKRYPIPHVNNKTINPFTKEVQKKMVIFAKETKLYDLLSEEDTKAEERQISAFKDLLHPNIPLESTDIPRHMIPISVINANAKLKKSEKISELLDNYRFAYLIGLAYQTASFQNIEILQLISDIVMVVFNFDDLLDHSESEIIGEKLQQIISYAPDIFSGKSEIPDELKRLPFLIGLRDTGTRLRTLIGPHTDTRDALKNTITALTNYLLETQVEKDNPEFIAKTEADLIKLRESRRKTTAINFFCHLGFALIGNPPIIQTHLFEQALFLTNDLVGSDNDLISLFKEQLAGSAGRTNFEARRKLHDPDPITSETQWREETVTELNTIISELLITAKRETDPNIEANSLECIILLINWVNGNLIWSDMSSRYKFSWNPDTSKFESKALPNQALIDEFTPPSSP